MLETDRRATSGPVSGVRDVLVVFRGVQEADGYAEWYPWAAEARSHLGYTYCLTQL